MYKKFIADIDNFHAADLTDEQLKDEEFILTLFVSLGKRDQGLSKTAFLVFSRMSKENQTFNVCLAAIKANANPALEYMRPEMIDRFTAEQVYELCEAAIIRTGFSLRFVPLNVFTEEQKNELCRKAVESDALALRFVPKELKTKELCLFAIQKNSRAYNYTPRDEWLEEYTEAAMKQEDIEDSIDRTNITFSPRGYVP